METNQEIIARLQSMFDELNAKFFGSSLPKVRMELSNRKRQFGCFSRIDNHIEISWHHIQLNPWNSSGQCNSVEETLIHEMIHYELWINQRYHGHGSLFKTRARETGLPSMDERCGRGATVQGGIVYECSCCKTQIRRHRHWSSKRYCVACTKATGVRCWFEEKI